jgi:hypothetical protein
MMADVWSMANKAKRTFATTDQEAESKKIVRARMRSVRYVRRVAERM